MVTLLNHGTLRNQLQRCFGSCTRFTPATSDRGYFRQLQPLVRRLIVCLISQPFEAGGERIHFPNQPSLWSATRVHRKSAGGAHLKTFQTTEPISIYREEPPKTTAWRRQHETNERPRLDSLHDQKELHTHIHFVPCAPPAERLTAAAELRQKCVHY